MRVLGKRSAFRGAVIAFAFAFATSMMITTATTHVLADTTTTACTSAAEDGQRARAAGKLRLAHRNFLACSGGEQCPSVVQRDCAKWASEVLEATPTIVIDARDAQGHDVGDATVTIDGEVVRTTIDGKAIEVDPGSHKIVLERRNTRATETIIAKEGVKTRPVRMTLEVVSTPPASVKPTKEEPNATTSGSGGGGGHTVFPWIVVGIGVVPIIMGTIVIATAPALPPGCDAETKECKPLTDGTGSPTSDPGFEQRQRDAGKSVDQPTYGAIILVAGVALVAGGLLWHFLEPTGTATASQAGARRQRRVINPTPWMGHNSGGLVASGTF